ncbi:MAG: hypothetical protein H0W73_06145 [Bacteroidetes bacterium]|nr:hypothetical protein [Bacteroidota bacterium]
MAVILFSSCAIHAGFPFICFKKDCIKSAWTFQKPPAGGKRGVKQKASIFIAKAKAKNRKRKSRNDDPLRMAFDQPLLDAMLADTSHADKFIKVVFFYKSKAPEKKINNDSLYIKSSFVTLSKNDRILINYYLNKYLVKNITEIYIYSVIEKKEELEQNSRMGIMKMKKIEHYLLRTKVKKERIKIVLK